MKCCGREFFNNKSFSNHKRWCSGKMTYKKNAGYDAIHAWVRRRKVKPKFCEKCKKNFSYDLANISGKYLRSISDYLYLCRSCHKIMDFKENTRLKFSRIACERKRNERGVFL